MATSTVSSSATSTRDGLSTAFGLALLWLVPALGAVLAFLLG